MGTPSEMIWPGYSELPAVQKMTFAEHPSGGLRQRIGSDLLSETGLSLLQGFLTYNPARRVTADAALEHDYFKVNMNIYISLSFAHGCPRLRPRAFSYGSLRTLR